jgi:hypothetical protein
MRRSKQTTLLWASCRTASLVELVAKGEPFLLDQNTKAADRPVEGVHHQLHLVGEHAKNEDNFINPTPVLK